MSRSEQMYQGQWTARRGSKICNGEKSSSFSNSVDGKTTEPAHVSVVL